MSMVFTTVTCPSCFEEIYLGECRIMSGITRGKVLREAKKGPLARMRVEPLTDREYIRELAYRECTYCQYHFPRNIEQVRNIRLAVVGDILSGKSHYIASLIHQIKRDWLSSTTGFARISCLTPEVERQYIQEYFEPLFRYKSVLAPTQQSTMLTANPLIYEITLARSRIHPPRSFNLMIYDAAGEDLENPQRLISFARFTLHPTAFIFMIDPFTMIPIYWQLPASMRVLLKRFFDISQGSRAADVFNKIITTFERFHGYSVRSDLPDIPIAIMLSKSDLFEYLHLPPGRLLMHPTYGDRIDLLDLDTVEQEVRSLLAANRQNDLLLAASRFKRVKFFASSATGESPDASGRFMTVNPCRCLDPLLWILYELGMVEAIE